MASLAPAPLPIWTSSRLRLQGLQDFHYGSRVPGPSCIPCKLTQFARLRTLTRRLARDPRGRDSGPESLKASRRSCSRRFVAFQVLHAAVRPAALGRGRSLVGEPVPSTPSRPTLARNRTRAFGVIKRTGTVTATLAAESRFENFRVSRTPRNNWTHARPHAPTYVSAYAKRCHFLFHFLYLVHIARFTALVPPATSRSPLL